MKSRILLINGTYDEQARVAALGVDADLGYLSNARNVGATWDNEMPPQAASIYTPLAPYEYKVIIIRLTAKPPNESTLAAKAKEITERDKVTLGSYWRERRGILVVLADDSAFIDLSLIGIDGATLEESSGNDATVDAYSSEPTDEIKKALHELRSQIKTPVSKYIRVLKRKSEYNTRHWTIYSPYTNRNDDDVGIYLDWGYEYEKSNTPAFLILPMYVENARAIVRLLKALATLGSAFLPEISSDEWSLSDSYYPESVRDIDRQIGVITSEAQKKIDALKESHKQLKEQYKHVHELLTQTGDALKQAVHQTLEEVFGLKAQDLDDERAGIFKEDLLIVDEKMNRTLFAEVKGTRNSTPTLAYVVQLQKNLLKRKSASAEGMLILNHDLTKDPNTRTDAYTSKDDSEAIQDISYLDTRVLFKLAIAILDGDESSEIGRNILFSGGRIEFK